MKRMLLWLTSVAVILSMMVIAPCTASAADVPSVKGYQYKVMQDFESLVPGFKFGGKDDIGYTMYLKEAMSYAGDVAKGGYAGSNAFRLYGIKKGKGQYAQPLINMLGYGEENSNCEFVGATEMWMWVDFSNITFDDVGLQLRIIETDCNPDGTPSTGDLSQFTLNKGKPVYIQADSKTWKKVIVKDQNKLPMAEMKNYKGFIRMPLSSMEVNFGEDLDNKINLENVSQLWFVFNWPDNAEKMSFSIDQVMFVGPSLKNGKDISRIKLTDTNQGKVAPTKSTKAPTTTTAATTETTTQTVATETTTEAVATTTATQTTVAEEAASGTNLTWLWITLAVVVVIGAGVAVYFLVIKKKSGNTEGKN